MESRVIRKYRNVHIAENFARKRQNEREYQRLKAYAESINKTMTEALKDGIELLYKNSQEKE